MAPLLNEEESALDPYVVLGVETTASEKDIKKAFRKMSLKCHPDKDPGEAAAIQFRQLSVAVEILSDPAKRAFLSTQLEAKRANKERYEKMHKKRQGAVDDLVAREAQAKKARADRAKATVQMHEENEIKEQGRKLREAAQLRAQQASKPPAPTLPPQDPTVQPDITSTDLTLSLQLAVNDTPTPAEFSSQALQSALSDRYGPISLLVMTEPKATSKKPKGKKAIVEFASGNWGGCWACWNDHNGDGSREVVKGMKAKWAAGEAPAWVGWAEKRKAAEKNAVPTFSFNPSEPAAAAPPSAAFESETLLRMRQLDRQRKLERERLEAEIRAEEGDE